MNVKKNNAVTHSITASLATIAFIATAPAQACEADPLLGSVCMTAASYCPRGFMDANGQLLPITEYQALFSLLGTNYGGDGKTTFGVPDMRGRSAVGLGQGSGLTAVKQGEKRGAEKTALSAANMPVHTHEVRAVNADGTSGAADNTWPANPVGDARGTPVNSTAYAESGTPVTLNNGVIGNTGGNIPFNNVPPQTGIRFCIATEGTFPSRN